MQLKSKSVGECRVWVGSRKRTGYGVVIIGGKPHYTHRLSYELHHGPIPEGKLVMHLCDNPPCINADHLRLGTDADNVADMDRKGRRRTVSRTGTTHYRTRFSDADVLAIRASKETHAALARYYGVSDGTIAAIRKRVNWKHLPDQRREP